MRHRLLPPPPPEKLDLRMSILRAHPASPLRPRGQAARRLFPLQDGPAASAEGARPGEGRGAISERRGGDGVEGGKH